MLNTMTGFYDRVHIDDAAAAARTIVIDTGAIRATDFNLDRDTQNLLFRQGREAALDFLDSASGQPTWDWETYKRTRSSQSPAVSVATPGAMPPAHYATAFTGALRTGIWHQLPHNLAAQRCGPD